MYTLGLVCTSCRASSTDRPFQQLVLKVLIGTLGYCLISINFAFALLTTSHPHHLLWLATLLFVHPLFAGNPSTGRRLLVLMLVSLLGLPPIWPILILQPIWCDLSHGVVVDTSDSIPLDFPKMLAWSYPPWGREL